MKYSFPGLPKGVMEEAIIRFSKLSPAQPVLWPMLISDGVVSLSRFILPCWLIPKAFESATTGSPWRKHGICLFAALLVVFGSVCGDSFFLLQYANISGCVNKPLGQKCEQMEQTG